MKLRSAVGVLLIALAWSASAGSTEPADTAATADTAEEVPTLRDPLPFEHARHRGAFALARVSCIDCHPIGLLQGTIEGTTSPVETIPVPISTCHGCHRGTYSRAPRAAAGTCASCHADVGDLMPDSHGDGWLHDHALDARAWTATCDDCHDAATCFACHDERGPLSESPHPPGFRTLHGIDARLDPRSCATCHTGETCLSCHSEGSFPW